jgi:hypothetical protein
MKKRVSSKGGVVGHAAGIFVLAFFMASLASITGQAIIEELSILSLSLASLFIVVLVGVLFDIVGVAATAADEAPLHARAANRVFGAARAVALVRNAHRVASFCNDVVGDICGALAGALGVTIVLKLLTQPSEQAIIWITTGMTAFVASLAVGGKALGKPYAMAHATTIMFRCGQALALIDLVRPRRVRRRVRRAHAGPPRRRPDKAEALPALPDGKPAAP